jgi:hypothetical protein
MASGKIGWARIVIFWVIQMDLTNLLGFAAAMGESTVILVVLPG